MMTRAVRTIVAVTAVVIGDPEIGRGAIEVVDAQLHIFDRTHHVAGTVDAQSCPVSALELREYWYVLDANRQLMGLVAQNAANSARPLSLNGRRLVQGAVVAAGAVNAAGEFDLTWSEAAWPERVPWLANARDDSSGASISAYRILVLDAAGRSDMVLRLDPLPMITFFGGETVKRVGRAKVNCFSTGG
jgi:hypothetical protein